MNKDIRIDWHSGMEITPQTFINLEEEMAEYRLLFQKTLSSRMFGIVPWEKFSCDVSVKDSIVYIKHLDGKILLPRGQMIIVSMEHAVEVRIPEVDIECLYLTIEPLDDSIPFELNGVPHLRQKLKIGLKDLKDMDNGDKLKGLFPFAKLVKDQDEWSVYDGYVPPCVAVRSSSVMMYLFDSVVKSVNKFVAHDSIRKTSNGLIAHIMFGELASFSIDCSPAELIAICNKVYMAFALILGYEYKAFDHSLMDVEPFFNKVLSFFQKAYNELDVVQTPPSEQKIEEILFCPII